MDLHYEHMKSRLVGCASNMRKTGDTEKKDTKTSIMIELQDKKTKLETLKATRQNHTLGGSEETRQQLTNHVHFVESKSSDNNNRSELEQSTSLSSDSEESSDADFIRTYEMCFSSSHHSQTPSTIYMAGEPEISV